MKDRLPIWFQSIALAVLCVVWMITVAWVGRRDSAFVPIGGFQSTVAQILSVHMPLAILFLGIRFVLQFADSSRRTGLVEGFFYVAGFILVLIVFGLMLLLPAVQRVREAGSYYADAKIVDVGRSVQ